MTPTPDTVPSPTITPTVSPTPTTPDSGLAPAEQELTRQLKKMVPAFTKASDEDLIAHAKTFCKDFSAAPTTATLQSFYNELKTKYAAQPYDVGVLAGAASATYCEDVLPKLKEAAQGLQR